MPSSKSRGKKTNQKILETILEKDLTLVSHRINHQLSKKLTSWYGVGGECCGYWADQSVVANSPCERGTSLTGHTLFQTGHTSLVVFALFLGQTPTANWRFNGPTGLPTGGMMAQLDCPSGSKKGQKRFGRALSPHQVGVTVLAPFKPCHVFDSRCQTHSGRGHVLESTWQPRGLCRSGIGRQIQPLGHNQLSSGAELIFHGFSIGSDLACM